ncbi:unnamed protein product [Rhizoctonia solani]|uniref:Uncharacterized protein n=1 Tax=Rhizoctonia solani TaxID=456999 RepID=A0A8H3AEK1_9AGAM|nr:unnamed protein product [Rhizoctonia solani]
MDEEARREREKAEQKARNAEREAEESLKASEEVEHTAKDEARCQEELQASERKIAAEAKRQAEERLAERKAAEERRAKEEAKRKEEELHAVLEAERMRREEAERKAEEERKAREELEAKRRNAEEELLAERKAKRVADRKAKEEKQRKAREKEEKRRVREEEDPEAREEEGRKAREEAYKQAERKAQEEAERKAKFKEERAEKEEKERKQMEREAKKRVERVDKKETGPEAREEEERKAGEVEVAAHTKSEVGAKVYPINMYKEKPDSSPPTSFTLVRRKASNPPAPLAPLANSAWSKGPPGLRNFTRPISCQYKYPDYSAPPSEHAGTQCPASEEAGPERSSSGHRTSNSSVNLGSIEATLLATTPAQSSAAAPLVPSQDPRFEFSGQDDLVSFPRSPRINQPPLAGPSTGGDQHAAESPHPHQYSPHSISPPRFGLAGCHYQPPDHYPHTERQMDEWVAEERVAGEEEELWEEVPAEVLAADDGFTVVTSKRSRGGGLHNHRKRIIGREFAQEWGAQVEWERRELGGLRELRELRERRERGERDEGAEWRGHWFGGAD